MIGDYVTIFLAHFYMLVIQHTIDIFTYINHFTSITAFVRYSRNTYVSGAPISVSVPFLLGMENKYQYRRLCCYGYNTGADVARIGAAYT